MEEEVWRRDWPEESHRYYKCRVRGSREPRYLYFHVCRESKQKRWLDENLNVIDGVIEWTPYEQKL